MAAKGFEAVIVNEIGCVYRQTPVSMSRNQPAMLQSRVEVCRHYFESLLERPCDSDLLVHILAGSSARLLAREFGFDSLSIVEGVLERLVMDPEEFSVYCADKLAATLPNLMTGLTMLRGQAEQPVWRSCTDLACRLYEKISSQSVTGLNHHPNLAWIEAELADAMISVGQIEQGRLMLARAITTPGPGAIERVGFRVLRLLSYLLPGRQASVLWGRLRAFSATLLGFR